MNRRFRGLVLCCALFALPFTIEAAAASKPRVPWTTTRLGGTPETPPPFRAMLAYPQLKPKQPIAAMREPGANRIVYLENYGYDELRGVLRRTSKANLPMQSGISFAGQAAQNAPRRRGLNAFELAALSPACHAEAA